MVLNDLGRTFLPRFENVLSELSHIRMEAFARKGVPTGEVKLGIQPSVAATLAGRLFSEVSNRFPKVKLVLLEGYSGVLQEWLESGRIDVGVLLHYGRSIPKDQDWLTDVDACLIGPAGDELTSGKGVAFESLDGLPLVLPMPPNALRTLLEQQSQRRNITLNTVVEANSIPVQLALVANGGCHSITPYHAVAEHVDAGILQASMITRPVIERCLALSITSQRPATLATKEVARLVKELVRELSRSQRWNVRDR